MATRQPKWYAVRKGRWLLIKESYDPLKLVNATIRIPRLPESPIRDIDGNTNHGFTFAQKDWEGGEIIGILPMTLFISKTGKYLGYNQCILLTKETKTAVKRLLTNI